MWHLEGDVDLLLRYTQEYLTNPLVWRGCLSDVASASTDKQTGLHLHSILQRQGGGALGPPPSFAGSAAESIANRLTKLCSALATV